MALVFWQNIVSPHMAPFLKAIANTKINVVLIVNQKISNSRKSMGWNEVEGIESEYLRLIVKPNSKQIIEIFDNYSDSNHFFSGTRSNPMIFQALKSSLKYDKVKRNLISEGPSFYKKPKILHLIKTLIFERKCLKKIDRVFAIGNDAEEWFKIWGFSKNQIIPFSYCVETLEHRYLETEHTADFNILFVGSLIKLKGLSEFFTQLNRIKTKVNVNIIGNGEELNNLKNEASKLKHSITFEGNKNNLEMRQTMSKFDCLILPSLYDGWGAVVNEGLMAGLFILCSDKCGSKNLIHNKFNGIVFSHQKKDSLYDALLFCVNNKKKIKDKQEEIINWSKKIEGKTIAHYFIESLSNQEIEIPWRTLN